MALKCCRSGGGSFLDWNRSQKNLPTEFLIRSDIIQTGRLSEQCNHNFKTVDSHKVTVGHIPQTISKTVSFFLKHGGKTMRAVIGGYRLSEIAGGLEVPNAIIHSRLNHR